MDVYSKQTRTVLERAIPVGQSSIEMQERCNIERVLRAAIYIVVGYRYTSCKEALDWFISDSVEDRRKNI